MFKRVSNIALGLALLLASLAEWGQGATWNWLTGNNLRGVKFLKGTNEGWTVGQRGLILHTTDGGDRWEVQTSNTEQDLWGVFFLDQNNGWVTGGYKTCLRTRDGGRNWQAIHTEPSGFSHFKGVCFLDTTVGWVVGPYDSILKTTDGGVNWTGSAMNSFNYWFGITFTESMHGWAVSNSGGRIARTTNGGTTWQDTSGVVPWGYGIDFFDTLRGWAVGAARAAYTTNGGVSWLRNSPTSALLYGVSFSDSLNGCVVGGENSNLATIARTTDGGISWSSQSYTNNSAFYGVTAPNTILVFVVGQSGSILKTTNGGLAWQIFRNLDDQGETMFNLALADTQAGYAVGPYGIVVKTTNGGTIWQRQNLGGTSLWFYGVDAPHPNYAWACGDGGSIYATKNGGTSWASQPSGVNWFLNSVDFVDTLFGVSVGGGYGPNDGEALGVRREARNNSLQNEKLAMQNAPIRYGISQGSTKWTTNNKIASSSRFASGTPRNDNSLKPWESPPLVEKWWWIKEGDPEISSGQAPEAQYRVITRTLDGTNWQGVTTGETPLNGVSFYDKALGWAVGVTGTVIHTSDSGATWQTQTSNVTNTLYWVIFPSPQNGWAVGTGGTIIATTDGGTTWNQQTSNTTLPLYSAAFVNAQRGWIVGDSGIALETTNGGQTWTFDTTRTKIPLYAASFTDRDHGWSIGGFGLTLGYGRAGQYGVEQRSTGAGELRVRNGIKAWPNPFVSYARVAGREKERFALYDVTGRRVGTYTGKRIGADIGSGVYFLMAENKEDRPVRIVKVR
jgi:photosystem II stability/assembly factor-like uncharacterized protein